MRQLFLNVFEAQFQIRNRSRVMVLGMVMLCQFLLRCIKSTVALRAGMQVCGLTYLYISQMEVGGMH